MTVKELRERLEEFSDDQEVCYIGPDKKCHIITCFTEISLTREGRRVNLWTGFIGIVGKSDFEGTFLELS